MLQMNPIFVAYCFFLMLKFYLEKVGYELVYLPETDIFEMILKKNTQWSEKVSILYVLILDREKRNFLFA